RIKGKIYYFGPWSDPEGAERRYNEQAEALHAGRKPREEPEGGLTVKQLVNKFLNSKQEAVDNHELSPRTLACYVEATDAIIATSGRPRLVTDLTPDDFAALRKRLAKKFGLHGLGVRIQCARSVFKYAFDAEMIDRPIRFGPGFKRPSKKTLRLHRAEQGP